MTIIPNSSETDDEDLSGAAIHPINSHQTNQIPDIRSRSELYDSLLEQSGDGVFVSDSVGNYIEVNSVGCILLGYSRDEIVQLNIADVLDPSEIKRIDSEVARLNTNQMVISKWKFRRKDGTTFLGLIRGRKLSDGKLQGVLVDITSKEQSDSILLDSERKLRGLFELSPFGIALTDMQGAFIEFNEAFRELCGYPEDELKSIDYWAQTPKKYEQAELDQIESMRRTGQYGPYEKEYLRKDGSLIPLQLNGMLITGQDGRQYIWSIVQDITQRRKSEQALRIRDERFQAMFDRASEGILLTTLDGAIIDGNESFARLRGYTTDQIKSMSIQQLQTPESGQLLLERLRRIAVEGSLSYELEHFHRDGHRIPIEASASLIIVNGESMIQSFSRDITERKLTERMLRESEERNRILIQQAPEAIFVFDVEASRMVDGNHNAELLFQCDRDQLLQRSPLDFLHKVESDPIPISTSFHEHNNQIMNGEQLIFERIVCGADGRESLCEIRLTKLPSGDRKLIRASIVDITARKQIELERQIALDLLSISEANLKAIFESSPEPIIISDDSGAITMINRQATRLLGYTADELIGCSVELLIPSQFRQSHVTMRHGYESGTLARRMAPTREVQVCHKDGTEIDVEISLSSIQIQSRLLIVSSLHDLTERRHAERVIKESDYRFHQLMENMSEGYTVLDFELRYVYQNKSAAMHSRNEPGTLIGKKPLDVFSDSKNIELFSLLNQVLSSRVAEYIETSFTFGDGTSSWFELRIAPVIEGISILSVDITQRKKIELELDQKRSAVTYLSRLAVLGELSGAIAHELNQPLMTILMNAESAKLLLSRDVKALDEVNEILTEIVDEDVRASGIIQRLRKLFSQQEIINLEVDINELVIDVGKILKNELINRSITLQLHLSDGISPINIDRIQVEQVLINLIVNACDALESNSPSQEKTVICMTSKETDGVKISVVDTAGGIAPDLLVKIFDPFFTTKKQGMGLGLSICKTIVSAHSGMLWAENNAVKGSSFHVMLPIRPRS